MTAQGTTASTADISWTENADNEDGFRLLRSLSEDFSNADTIEIESDTESYTDQNLEANTKYYYKIQAFNGNVSSEFSNVVNTSTNNQLISPSELRADPITPTQIDISWKDNSSDEEKFVLERSTSKTDFSDATSIDVDKDATSYSDTELTTGNVYWYRIKGVKGDLSSSYSNLDSAEIGIYTALIDGIKTEVRMYPNPSMGSVVYLKLDQKFKRNIDLNIISYSGQVVRRFQNLQQNTNLEIEFDVQNLKPGVYVVEVVAENISHLKLIHDK